MRLFRSSALVRASAIGLRLSALALLLAAGCVTKQSADNQARRAFDAGLQQGRKEAEVRLTHVMIRGPVQHSAVPWRDGLTLAQAIVEAVYTAAKDPVAISITRDNRVLPVNLDELLRGVDIPLLAGDVIDIR
jgi:hypothetical protein